MKWLREALSDGAKVSLSHLLLALAVLTALGVAIAHAFKLAADVPDSLNHLIEVLAVRSGWSRVPEMVNKATNAIQGKKSEDV